MQSVILKAAALVALGGLAQAQVYASDDFSYVGDLTANGWTAHSGAGNKVVQSDGLVATLDQSSGSGEDVSLTFPAVGATDTTYASFTLNIPSGNPVNPDSSGLYFAHFKDSSFSFRARTGVLSPASGGDFLIAVNGDNSNLGAGSQWASDSSFDTDYKIVIKWDAATGEGRLWVDPTAETDTSIAHTGGFTGDLMEAFALRQSNDYTGFITIDDVVVGNTFDDVCGTPPTNYCTSGISAVGCTATISASGTPSATATSGFTVMGSGAEGLKTGIFFYGTNGRQANPWGNGTSFQCVVPPVKRGGLLNGTGTPLLCDGTFSQDLNSRWCPTCSHPSHNPGAGTVTQAQLWYRDPLNTSNQTTSLSDAIEFTVGP